MRNQGLQPGTDSLFDGRYLLGDRIDQGGMGTVFRAEQVLLERPVAIKVLHAELASQPEYVQRMSVEAVAASRVRSPHSVRVFDFSALPDGTPYLVMEHVPGRTLRRVLADDAVSLPRAIDLVEQILTALGATHDSGVVHGDVKSDNFLVDAARGRDHVTLIDFGLARIEGAPVQPDTEQGEVMVSGTPAYMAPEVICGEPPTASSDLYGAGVILYELLTGETPFAGGTAMEIMIKHVQDAVIPPSLRCPDRDIPAALDRVVLRALDKRPRMRFADAAEFARELRAAVRAPRMPVGRPAAIQASSLPLSPTRDWAPLPRRRLARGTDTGVASTTDDDRDDRDDPDASYAAA
jgi:serine/threonine-protein kinase